jgi:hypothetical protein
VSTSPCVSLPFCSKEVRLFCCLAEGGWEHNPSKGLLDSLVLRVFNTHLALSLQAESHVVNSVLDEGYARDIFEPVRKETQPSWTPEQAVTVRSAVPTEECKVWHFPGSRSPQAAHSTDISDFPYRARPCADLGIHSKGGKESSRPSAWIGYWGQNLISKKIEKNKTKHL